MGYGGFKRFRERVAMVTSEEFGDHYATLGTGLFLPDSERETFFKRFDTKTLKLIEKEIVKPEIVDFCLQSDCEGKVKRKQAKVIYEAIKDYSDNIAYGYFGRSDCATFDSIKAIFADSAENGGKVTWH